MVTEFRAAPISENRLLSCGDLLGGPQTFTFHEETGGAFQLMYTGHRLARRRNRLVAALFTTTHVTR